VSADALEQVARRGQLEPSRERDKRVQAWRALSTLEQADLRTVQVAKLRKPFLRQARVAAVAAKIAPELLANDIHSVNFAAKADICLETVVCRMLGVGFERFVPSARLNGGQ
jgi:hypothetical protein